MQKKSKAFIGSLIVVAYFMMFLASTPQKKAPVEKPGWYGITEGWNNWNSDVDGQVGYKMYVGGPRGRCLPSRSWTANTTIVSGTLPPGLYFENDNITGIPTERGHWIIKLKLSNIQCGGNYYKDFEQELRFHITGSGRVNN